MASLIPRTTATLLGNSEILRTQVLAQGVDRHPCKSSVPILTHQEVLDFEGKDEHGKLTPEAQLRKHVLETSRRKWLPRKAIHQVDPMQMFRVLREWQAREKRLH